MRIFLLTFTLFLFTSGACLGADAVKPVVKPKETTQSPSSGFVGQPVAAFEAITTAGVNISSASHGAKALVITLWGLSCVSCLDEMKALEPLYQEYRDQGLKIWAINTEDIDAREIEKGLRIREFDLTYDLVPDPGLKITKLFTNWFIPVTVIVDSEGIVQYYKIGFNESDAESVKAKVGTLLSR